MANKKQDIAGWNDRFHRDRNQGFNGAGAGANCFPREDQTTSTATNPAANYDGALSLPAGTIVSAVIMTVNTVFDGVPTITVGSTGDPDLLVTLADAIDLTTTGIKRVSRETAWPLASVVRTVIGGAPTQGSVDVTVQYQI